MVVWQDGGQNGAERTTAQLECAEEQMIEYFNIFLFHIFFLKHNLMAE